MKLTKRNYFSKKANREYMSVSQFKTFEECPNRAIAEMKGSWVREKTTPLLVGSYVDAYFEGTLEKFKKNNPEIFRKDGILKSDYIQAEEIIKRIERDKLFMEYISGKSQVVMTGVIAGIPVKVKIDSLLPDRIVDLKIVRDFQPIYKEEQGRLPWFQAWRYDLQGAVYQEIVRQNTGLILPFYLAAATKEKTTDLDIVQVESDLMEYELNLFMERAPYYDAIKKGVITPERCECCDWCKETKILAAPKSSKEFLL